MPVSFITGSSLKPGQFMFTKVKLGINTLGYIINHYIALNFCKACLKGFLTMFSLQIAILYSFFTPKILCIFYPKNIMHLKILVILKSLKNNVSIFFRLLWMLHNDVNTFRETANEFVLLEAFLESAPQLILQLSVILRTGSACE